MAKHHSPPPSGRPTHFVIAGSPLDGKRIPMDWGRLTIRGKAEALVKVGYAPTYGKAMEMIGHHAAAIGRAKARRTGEKPGAEAGNDLKRERWWDK